MNELEFKKKFNDLSMKMEDNQDKVMRIEKLHDYIKERKLEEYNEKAQRIEQMM